MKLNYYTASKIKEDFNYLVGRPVITKESIEKIKEIVVMPFIDNTFGTFPIHYSMTIDKQNFLIPHLDKEMSLLIYLTDDSHILFFQYLIDENIKIDWTKYLNE